MSQIGVNPDGSTRQRVDQRARQVFGTWRTPNCGSENSTRGGLVITAEERQTLGRQVMLAHQVASLISPPGPPAQPTTTDGEPSSPAGRNSRLPSMWPTPDANPEAPNSSTNRGTNWGGERRRLSVCGIGNAADMWATPQANADAGSRNTEGSKAHAGTSLADMVTTGSSRTGRQGNTRRLNPKFVAWLCAFPPDWCDEIPRTDQLRAYGNSVVWPQGAYAIAVLWQELRAATAADEGAA